MDFRKKLYNKYVSSFKNKQYHVEKQWSEHCRVWADFKYMPFLLGSKPGCSMLEMGCGQGHLMEFLKDKGFKNIHGIDISEEQIQLAQEKGLKAVVANVFDFLKSNKDVFNVIIGIDFLEHFTKDELMELIPLIQMNLKNNGKLILQLPNGQGLFPGQVIYGDMTHLTIFTPRSLSQLLELHGFKDISFYETGPILYGIKGYFKMFCLEMYKANSLFNEENRNRRHTTYLD